MRDNRLLRAESFSFTRGDGRDLSKAANILKVSKNSLVNNADSASNENWVLSTYLIFLISAYWEMLKKYICEFNHTSLGSSSTRICPGSDDDSDDMR